ncbi:MAG: carboxypeptidase-like regulatory domain-containing protein, partial [Flavobacteriales bacterium]|nr:carboxypeptidase-like regulatory domain-containing protein [Flavobacteriales bacterium]
MKKLLPFLSLLFTLSTTAQIQIKGTIIDGLSNETLIGANVIITESGKGTSTNFNGEYSLIYKGDLPTTLSISYLGYKTLEIEITTKNPKPIKLFSDSKNLKEVKVVDSRITQKQKEAALTVESLDMIAIKETPSANFYDGLGALKGVDITAASLGFKVINTRGFNSTSPVRSLQIIDGVDNQSPGLNFSLGNFLGSSELDIQRVEIIQGASSAYYGPNAFNGVISMETRNPFIQPGLSIQYKFGSRNLFENSVRLAEKFQNSKGKDVFAFKINVSYMQAHDWEADNMAAVDGTTSADNPGGYDAINRYGDEDTDGNLNDVRDNFNLNYFTHPGLGKFHRTGYMEKDIVDYNTKNFKAQSSLHFMLTPKTELIYALNYSTGTTVYQGDNRFSLKNIQFWQNKLELKQKDKFFIRAYRTEEDAGDSYDAVFTALKLQEYNQVDNQEWYTAYKNNWKDNFSWDDVNFEYLMQLDSMDFNTGSFYYSYLINETAYTQNEFTNICDSVLNANTDLIIANHGTVRDLTDLESNRLVPGTEEFKAALEDITSKTAYLHGGTGFYDKSALNHIHGEYFLLNNNFEKIKIGANFRQYTPDTKGSLFMDTATMITNNEAGIYMGFEKK